MGYTCTESKSEIGCGALEFLYKNGTCAAAGYTYCFTTAKYDQVLWSNGKGFGCSKGKQILRERGFQNDGCGGKSAPVSCTS
mmetsp:Transcript_52450/g.140390  ORF Transcript_52450/g.140390 Transcript_52450/m.140390 type:complete len:82 (-) Transcript_52450:101-346(-)